MLQLICFFAPALFAAYLYEENMKESFSFKKFLVIYTAFVGVINMLCLGSVAILLHHPDYVLNIDMISIGFAFKYLLLGYVLAVILSIGCSVVKKCIRIEFIVEPENEAAPDDK